MTTKAKKNYYNFKFEAGDHGYIQDGQKSWAE